MVIGENSPCGLASCSRSAKTQRHHVSSLLLEWNTTGFNLQLFSNEDMYVCAGTVQHVHVCVSVCRGSKIGPVIGLFIIQRVHGVCVCVCVYVNMSVHAQMCVCGHDHDVCVSW